MSVRGLGRVGVAFFALAAGALAGDVAGLLCCALVACAQSAPDEDNARRVQADALPPSPDPEYAFFVAGHVYGKPGGDSLGLYGPFAARLPWLLERPGLSFGVLLGDVVRRPNGRHWDPVAREIAEIPVPVHLVAGNHDIAYEGAEGRNDLLFRAGYEERFGPTYYAFRHEGDLFLVFDTTLDHWNVSGPQLELLVRELGAPYRNLFVFVHHVIWWRPEDQPDLRPNSLDGRSKGTPNFWSEIAPLLRATGVETYLFAGDLGAHAGATPYSYRRDGTLHLVASGMGEGTQDNCLLVEVDREGRVELHRILLTVPDTSPPLPGNSVPHKKAR